MNRIFLLDVAWDEKLDIDAIVARHVLQHLCARNCDRWELGDNCSDFTERCIPIGDLDWLEYWIQRTKGTGCHIPPIEIPECLRHFCKRSYQIIRGSDIPRNLRYGSTFLKDATALKSWNNVLYEGMDSADMYRFINPTHLYVVSERVEFLSEWRIFVYHDKIVGCQNYLGDPSIFPSREAITSMVSTYRLNDRERPKAYTIDVGVVSKKYRGFQRFPNDHTEPIEIHPFAACGLYGFCEDILIEMWEEGWKWCLEHSSSQAI